MSIYLPIAETSINLFLILGLGGSVGLLSGLFGVGGGFLLTPLLIFIGIPPTVAVASGANQVVASSVSGLIAHSRRGNVDVSMGVVLIAGGLLGSVAGVLLFGLLRRLGQVDFAISVSYVLLLGSVGTLMLVESARKLTRRPQGRSRQRLHQHYLLHRLPVRRRFRKSRLYISAILPFGLGVFAGILTAIMGVGGGFILVPAMIYVIGMPTSVTVGTSLLQITVVSAMVTFLQAVTTQAVDALLALLLAVGATVGAQIGARFAARIRGEQLRFLLALVVIGVCVEVALGLFRAPADPFFLVPRVS